MVAAAHAAAAGLAEAYLKATDPADLVVFEAVGLKRRQQQAEDLAAMFGEGS